MLLFVLGCAHPVPPPLPVPEPEPPRPEVLVDPATVGLDPAALDALIDGASASRSDALHVEVHGTVVVDFPPAREQRRIELMSVTKSVAALAVGFLLAEGHVATLDQPLDRWFPELEGRGITVRHLLAHTTGLADPPDTGAIYDAGDMVAYALAAEQTAPPGVVWDYNNTASNLVPELVRRASGEPIDTYLQARLFTPLHIPVPTWQTDTAGHLQGMAGLSLRADELARIGRMLSDHGRFEGHRVLSEGFVRELVSPAANAGYGLQWWTVLADRQCVITDGLIDTWRAMGVDEDFLNRIAPLVGRPVPDHDAFFAMVSTALDGDMDRWNRTTWESGRPDCEPVGTPIGFRGDGYLGQAVVVLPDAGLVAVRQIAWREDLERSDTFHEFTEEVVALVTDTSGRP
ncbi:MAG: beta-lactamase family protein [Alphaproteobacteria bacterium]|nr:beta-lactamase family protein [Alphaproteobacteria bacterium]